MTTHIHSFLEHYQKLSLWSLQSVQTLSWHSESENDIGKKQSYTFNHISFSYWQIMFVDLKHDK